MQTSSLYNVEFAAADFVVRAALLAEAETAAEAVRGAEVGREEEEEAAAAA